MISLNFLFTQAQQLQNIDFYKHEFLFHICCDNYQLSLAFSKMINTENIDIKELLEKLLKMSPPPLEQLFMTKNAGNAVQNFFRSPIPKKSPANSKLNKSKEMLLYYYLLHCIQYYYDPNTKKIDYTPFYLNSFLTEFSDPKLSIKVNGNYAAGWSEQLYQYMTSSLDIPQNQFQTILKGLLAFATQDKALYFSLKPQVSSILARIGAQNYLPILEFNIFDVLLNIDPSILILFPPNFVNSSNISKFLQYPAVLLNPQFINLSQTLIGSTDPFPLESNLFKNSNLLTLVNHTIMKRKHFVDVIFSFAHNTLMIRDFNNVEAILDVLSDAPHSELKPWLMLVDFNDLYPDQDFLMSVIPLYTDSSNRQNNFNQNSDSIQKLDKENLNISNNKNMNILIRLKNDNMLLTYINQAIGICINSDGISKETLPKYISGIIGNINLNDLVHFSKLEYFMISDHDRDSDFNFIFLYLIYSFILNSLKYSFKLRKDQQLKDGENITVNINEEYKLNTDKVDNYLRNIKINQDILINIFSLLFVQDRASGEYVASIEDARIILSVLVQYAHDFIQHHKKSSAPDSKPNALYTIVMGFSKIQQFIVLNDKSNISDCFVSTLEIIISALEKHDYEIAKRFASQSNSQNLLTIIEFSEVIYTYANSGYKDEILSNFLNSLNNTKNGEIVQKFLVELAMSTHSRIDEISFDPYKIDAEFSFKNCLFSLIKERKKIKKVRDILYSSIGSSDYLKDIIDEARLRMFFGGNEVYVDWSDNEDDSNRLIGPDNFPVLSNFIEHYELFLKLSVNQSQTSSSLPINNSDQSLDLILDSIIQSDKIDSWETFTQLVGSNALEMIVLHCDLTKASEQITLLIEEQMPIIGELIKIQKKYPNNGILVKDDKLSEQAISKILILIGDKNKELTDILTNKKNSSNDEQIKMKNSSLSFIADILNDFSNANKVNFILTLFKLINESFPNKFESSNNLSSAFFIVSENLLLFLEIIDDILQFDKQYHQTMSKIASLLINEIINFFNYNPQARFLPFPTEFIYEFRIKSDVLIYNNINEFELFSNSNLNDSPFNIFLPNFVSDIKKNFTLSLIDLVNIFPEKATRTIYYFIANGITSVDPKEIIKQLIKKHQISYAHKFSRDDQYLSSFFINELINYVIWKIGQIINESTNLNNDNEFIQQEITKFINSLFLEDPKLANSIYSKLPINLIQSYYQITIAFQSIISPSKKSNNDEQSLLSQEENNSIYDDFNEQVYNLLHENKTLEWIQISVDYILNIYLNPNIINELDDEYSIYIKKKKISWSEEQKKSFIRTVQSVLLFIIKTNYSLVNSVEEEKLALRSLKKSIKIIRQILYSFNLDIPNLHEDSYCGYAGSLEFLHDFVHEEYNQRFNENYSLTDINRLMKICIKYDNFYLIKKKFLITFLSKDSPNPPLQSESSSNLFASSIRNCFAEVAKNLLLLNQTEEYIKILDFLSHIQNMFCFESKVDISDLLRILSHPNFFELNFNDDIVHVEVSPLYYRVKMIIGGNMALVNKEFFKLTDRTISCFNGEKDLIRFHNQYGRFEIDIETKHQQISQELPILSSRPSSFSPIEDLVRNRDFMKVFQSSLLDKNDQKLAYFDAFESLESAIDYVIYPCLSYNHWNGLWRFLTRSLLSNPSSSRVKIIIDEFLEFLRSKNMAFLLFDIENRLQMREDAILDAFEIFHNLCTWNDRANYSNKLKELCENEINSRKNEGKKPQKVSDGVLNTIYEKSLIYSQFCQFCHETNTSFDKNLDIFSKGIVINSNRNHNSSYQSQSRFQTREKNKDEVNSKDHIIELMAFLAFVKKNFVLGLKIARMKPSCTESVMKNSIETIFCAGKDEIKSFMILLRNQLFENLNNQISDTNHDTKNNLDYEKIALIAVECVEKKLAKKANLSRFIIDYVSGSAFQVSLLLKYGFPHEALKICNHDKQNIKMVHEYALQTNDLKLIRECKKLLS